MRSTTARIALERLEDRRLLSGASTSGAIDASFGQSGIAAVPIAGVSYVNALDMAVQGDGKILIAGSAYIDTSTGGGNSGGGGKVVPIASPQPISYSANQEMMLARLNADGTPDKSFGSGGAVLADFSAPDAQANRILQDAQGRILVAGDANGDFGLARFNPDGSPDPTFGQGGKLTLDLGSGSDKAWGLALEADGKILVDGQTGGQLALIRLDDNGSLDSAFGTGGKTLVAPPGFVAPASSDVADPIPGPTLDGSGGVSILRDGRLLVVSNEDAGDGTGRVALTYFNADGSLAALDQGPSQESVPQVVNYSVLADGRVLAFSSDGVNTVERFNPDASLDASFGQGGIAPPLLDWGGFGSVQADGKILVTGAGSVGYNEGVAVVRYNSDGSPDASFGVDGRVISVAAGGQGAAVAVDGLGRIVAVSSNYDDAGGQPTLTAARFLPDVGITPPTATLVSAPTLSHRGKDQVILTVTYQSAQGIDDNSLEDSNLTVTLDGSEGAVSLPVYFLDNIDHADGSVTAHYQVQKDYSGHRFNSADDGTYTVALNPGEVYDLSGAAAPQGPLGQFAITIPPPPGGIVLPKATLAASDISIVNVTDQTLTVTYASPVGIDENSVGGSELNVAGPGGVSQTATFQSEQANADGSVIATYQLQRDGEHRTFTTADNGAYQVSVDAGAVTDQEGTRLAAGILGTFQVHVPPPQTGPAAPTATLQAADLTDPNVSQEVLAVTYKGQGAIAINTLDNFDLMVDGPNGYHQTAQFTGSVVNGDGSTTASYAVSRGFFWGEPIPLAGTGGVVTLGASGGQGTAAGPTRATTAAPVGVAGTTSGALRPIIYPPIWWGRLSNGTYTVSIQSGQVNDAVGSAIPAGKLGTFNVNLPPGSGRIPPILIQGGAVALASAGSGGASSAINAHHPAVNTTSAGATHHAPVRAHAKPRKKSHTKHPGKGKHHVTGKSATHAGSNFVAGQ